MKLVRCLLSVLAILITTVHANTEKAIFLGPTASNLQQSFPCLDHLYLETLSPTSPSLRKSLPAAFPTDQQPYGLESWYLLRHLTAGQRYEIRICWAAIQPTAFSIDTFDISEAAKNPVLSGLGDYNGPQHEENIDNPEASQESALLLRVRTAADFFTINQTLMQSPPDVHVDIILDPFIANIFPASLGWTTIYIVALAVGSWFISGFVWSRLKQIAESLSKAHVD